MFSAVFICSFSNLRNDQLESDVCLLPYTWSLKTSNVRKVTRKRQSSTSVNLHELRRHRPVADPDLQIRGEGGGGHPDHKIRGAVLKNFFSAFRASVWSRSKWGQVWGGGVGPPGPLPWIRHCARPFIHCLYFTCPRKNYATVETHH